MAGEGSCLVTNESSSLRNAILRDRVDGKSWQQIANERGLSSPGAARREFGMATGLSDFKIRGSKLSNVIENQAKEIPWKASMTRAEADLYTKGSKISGPRYHGTGSSKAADGLSTIGFDDEMIGSATGNYGMLGKGHYFTSDTSYAQVYAGSGEVLEVRLLVRNPMPRKEFLEMVKEEGLTFTREGSQRAAELIQERGYDGLQYVVNPDKSDLDEIVVFGREQIVVVSP